MLLFNGKLFYYGAPSAFSFSFSLLFKVPLSETAKLQSRIDNTKLGRYLHYASSVGWFSAWRCTLKQDFDVRHLRCVIAKLNSDCETVINKLIIYYS
jgi:hypothetical protein